MFFKLSALAALVPLVASLSLEVPKDPHSDGQVTINWTTDPSDNVFSIELHHPTFNNDYAIANNVNPADGSTTRTFPEVPAQDGYTLRAVNIGNISDVYAESGSFSIAAPLSTSSSSAASTASGSAASGASGSTASTSVLGVSAASTSAFGVTRSNTGSGASASATAPSGNASGTSSSSSAGASATNLNGNGAATAKIGSTVGLLAAVAGVAAFAL